MGNFHVELKKVVDDSYNIETGCDLWDMLKADLKSGILGKSKKIALITDSTVMELYGKCAEEAIKKAGLDVNTYVFPAGEKSKTRATKEMLEDAMLADGLKRDCGVVALDYRGDKGIATALGHAPQAGLASPEAGSVLSVAERI